MTQLIEKTRFGWGETDKGFHVGSKPWYAVGTQLVDKAPTMEEGIKLAGLDWKVSLQELQTADGVKTEFKGVIREDNNACLGAVTDSYTPLQNSEAFKFFEPFLETGQATLDCAGSFHNGRRVWIVAKINRDDIVFDEAHNDVIQKYILLSNAHNAKSAVMVGYIPYRICCSNSLTAAENSEQSNLIRVYHRKNVAQTLESIQQTMCLIDQTFKTSEELYKQLMKKPVNKEDLHRYVNVVFSNKSLKQLCENETGFSDYDVKEVRKSLMNYVEEIFDKEYAHTAWNAYNAINHRLNHDRGRSQESAYNSLWFESAKTLDKRALVLATRL